MKVTLRAFIQKTTLIATAFVLAVSTLTASLPFVLSQEAGAAPVVNVTDLSSWWFEDKSNGHHELVASGLHVWTTGGSTDGSTRKSAGYTAVTPFPLANAADADIQFAGTPTGPLPSLQLGVDRDGNGSWDGYLVYEPWSYGVGKFWIDKPGFGVAAGQGYQSFGTIADFAAANQDAKVISVGYSLGTLGSHPDGDSVISKLKVAGTEYNFVDTTAPIITINGATTANKVYPAGTVRIQVADSNYDKTVIQQKDANGNYVDRFTYVTSKGKSFTIQWLGDGGYRVQAFDTANNASKVLTFAIDTTAPQTTFNTPTAGQTVGHSFTLSGKATDNIGLNRVYVQLVNRENSQRYAGQTIHLSGTEQDWTYTIDANALNLPEGTYAAHVAVVDNIGNTSSVGWTANFKLDKTVPVFEITNLKDGDIISTKPSNKIVVNGTLTDPSGAYAFLQLVKDGVSRGGVTTYAQITNDKLGEFDATNLEDGQYDLFYTPTDYLGNAIERSVIHFTIDNTAPAVSEIRLNGTTISGQYQRNDNCAPINKLYPVSGSLNLTSVIDDANGVVKASYSVRKLLDNGCSDTAAYKSATIALEQSSKSASNWNQPAGAVLDTHAAGLNGKYVIVLVTEDATGNKTVKYVDLNVDNTKPTVKVNLNRNGYLDNNGVTRKVANPEIEAFDTNLTEIKITDENGNEVTHWGNGQSSVTPGVTTRKNINWLGEGIYKIYAYDAMGNVSDVFTFTMDNSAPQLTVDDPADLVVYGDTVDVTGSVFDAHLSEYKYQILDANKQKTLGSEGWSRLGGTANTNGTLFTANIANLADGTYYISVWATDKAGNATNQSGSRLAAPYIMKFTINRVINASIDAIATNTTTPTVSGIVTRDADGSPLANTDLVVTIDGTDEYEVTTDAFGVWSVDVVVTGSEAGVSHTVAVALKGSDPTATPAGTTTFTTTLQSQTQRGATNTRGAAARGATQPQLPSVTGPAGQPGAAALGAGDEAGKESALGASTEKTLADAVDANNTDGKALGLAWYWWILIVAALATIVWWIVAAVRKRSAES